MPASKNRQNRSAEQMERSDQDTGEVERLQAESTM